MTKNSITKKALSFVLVLCMMLSFSSVAFAGRPAAGNNRDLTITTNLPISWITCKGPDGFVTGDATTGGVKFSLSTTDEYKICFNYDDDVFSFNSSDSDVELTKGDSYYFTITINANTTKTAKFTLNYPISTLPKGSKNYSIEYVPGITDDQAKSIYTYYRNQDGNSEFKDRMYFRYDEQADRDRQCSIVNYESSKVDVAATRISDISIGLGNRSLFFIGTVKFKTSVKQGITGGTITDISKTALSAGDTLTFKVTPSSACSVVDTITVAGTTISLKDCYNATTGEVTCTIPATIKDTAEINATFKASHDYGTNPEVDTLVEGETCLYYKTKLCNTCGTPAATQIDEESGEPVTYYIHDFGTNTEKNTAVEDEDCLFYKTKKCTKCEKDIATDIDEESGEPKTFYVHDYNAEQDYLVEGETCLYYSAKVCKVCEYEDVTSEENFYKHNSDGGKKYNEQAATCVVDGSYDLIAKCTVCTTQIGETQHITVTAPGHSFGKWEVIREPSETEKGLMKRTCTVKDCNAYEEKDFTNGDFSRYNMSFWAWIIYITFSTALNAIKNLVKAK